MRQVLIPLDLEPATSRRATVDETVRVLGGETMGTNWSLRLSAHGGRPLSALQRDIEAALAEVVGQMSPWEPESCLMRFSRAPAGTWHHLPEDFFAVLDCALSVAGATGGALDPTIGGLIDRWGFGPPELRTTGSSPARQAHHRTAFRIDRERRRAFQPGGVRLDLCAVAKGFAVDRLSEVIARYGIRSYLVEIGGELRGAGVKPDGQPWWVAVEEAPALGGRPFPETVVALHGVSIATSGGYRRYRDTGAGPRTHLIDPRRGVPSDDTASTVSVVARECMHADAWATALAVLGPVEGLRVAAENGIAALLASGTGRERQVDVSPAMAAMLA